jgi:hypothetical protein
VDQHRSDLRDAGLARTRAWTRRTAAVTAVLCAALAGVFAQVLPGRAAVPGTASRPTGHSPSKPGLQAPAQPPATGSDQPQVTSGGS